MDRWITDWEPSARFPLYTRANAGEVLPAPVTPLGWTLVWEQAVLPGWRDGNIEFGLARPEELPETRPPVVGMFAGYFYVNLSCVRLNGVRIPGMTVEAFDGAFFGEHPGVPPYEAHPGDACPECTAKITETLGWIMGSESWPELDADRDAARQARATRPNLAALGDAELVGRARAYLPLVRRLFARHVVATVASSVGPGAMAASLAAAGRPELLVRLIAGLGEVDSAAPSFALWELSRREPGAPRDAAFAAFLEEYGSRGPNEWDVGASTWETDPEQVQGLIGQMAALPDERAPATHQHRLAEERARLTAEVAASLPADEAQAFLAAARSAAIFLAARERSKTNAVRVIHEIRMALRELGRRKGASGQLPDPLDIMMLRAEELDDYLANSAAFGTVLGARREEFAALGELDPPFILRAGEIPPVGEWPRKRRRSDPAGAGEVLAGAPGCGGRASGPARVVHDPFAAGDLRPGDVLVAPVTDPAWTPLFLTAAAIVVDTGAPNSHAVIVSRELGRPCVVSVRDATARIPDGALVAVDGDRGTVTLEALPDQEEPSR